METPVVFLIVEFDGDGMVSILIHSPDKASEIKAYKQSVNDQGLNCTPYIDTSDFPSKEYYQVEMYGVSAVARRRRRLCALP